ncbi:MAG: conjugative transposon protein TraM [Chitinophagaceae bacterium]|nr:conjugative transposon protein TraM [Chitinophagaceae bacterium]
MSLNNERLEAEINSIRYGNSLFPVKLEIYDMDGLPGIYIPVLSAGMLVNNLLILVCS